MKTVFTAVFGPYDDLKTPLVVTPGWRYICFTDQPFKNDVWEVIQRPLMPEGAPRTARFYKIMFHRHIESEDSLWIDASFIINCNLDEWWKRFKEPITCVKHPIRNDVYSEAQACIDQRRGDGRTIMKQVELYWKIGLPKNNGLIASGILMRQMKQPVIDICDLWWRHLCEHSSRDQISLAYAVWKMPIPYYTEYNYSGETDFLYMYHLNSPKRQKKIDYYKSINILK